MKQVIIFLVTIVAFATGTVNAQISFEETKFIKLDNMRNAKSCIAGDFNHDNKDDFAIYYETYESKNYFKIYYQNKSNKRYSLDNRFRQVKKIVKGDFNNDGRVDFAFINVYSQGRNGTPSICFVYQEQNGSYDFKNAELIPTAWMPENASVCDLDNDGDDDLVVCHSNVSRGENHIRLYYQEQNSFLEQKILSVNAGGSQILCEDMNNDGWNDIVFMAGDWAYENKGLYVYLNKRGKFYANKVDSFLYKGSFMGGICIGNLRNLGNEILMVTHDYSYIARYDSQNIFGKRKNLVKELVNMNGNGASKEVFDINNDGVAEFIDYDNGYCIIYDFKNNTSLKIEVPTANIHSHDQCIAIGYFTGDKKPDIILLNDNRGIYLLENNGNVN